MAEAMYERRSSHRVWPSRGRTWPAAARGPGGFLSSTVEREGGLMSKRRPSRCPDCGVERVARILYGLVLPAKKLRRKIGVGEVVLGGCIILDGDPLWECLACHHRWGGRGPSTGMASSVGRSDAADRSAAGRW